uniref:Uncharacterized protein n=1 Tax=Anguilla anguilla TaxID=7936 RepID=A0A0E9TWU5_ANGAN
MHIGNNLDTAVRCAIIVPCVVNLACTGLKRHPSCK